MKKTGLWGLVALLIVGALYLVNRKSDTEAAETDTRPQPSATAQPTPVPRGVQVILPEPTAPPSNASVRAVELPSATPEPTRGPATPTAAPTEAPPANPEVPAFVQHTIEPGETLLGIAVENGVSMAAIQLANQMGSSIDLLAGQTLTIPGNTQWLDENAFWVTHVVMSGETLVSVASRYDLTVDDILRVNAIADPDLIHSDQTLVLPLAQLVILKQPEPTEDAVAIAAAPVASSSMAIQTPESSQPEENSPPPAEPVAAPNMPSGPVDWPGYILARINQARSENGLYHLTLVAELSAAAQAHAEDCARRGWGSHVGSDGAVLRTRLERVGYIGAGQGENWVQARNAERAFDWWYGEIPPNDPHRRNILSPRYTEIGIGIVETGWGFVFVTDFGRR